ncbi:hypothetical protein THAOC_33948, partial [Thalassiosira oceanica]
MLKFSQSIYLLTRSGGAISGAIRGAKDSTWGNSAATKRDVQPSDATWALFSACRALSAGMKFAALRAGRRHVTPVLRAGPTVLAPEIAPGGRVLNRPDIAPEIERDRANLSLAPERGWIAPPLHASAALKIASGAKKKDLAPEIAPRLQAVLDLSHAKQKHKGDAVAVAGRRRGRDAAPRARVEQYRRQMCRDVQQAIKMFLRPLARPWLGSGAEGEDSGAATASEEGLALVFGRASVQREEQAGRWEAWTEG